MQHGQQIGGFIGALDGLRDAEDRAALAALRRGLGKPPGTAPEMFPIVVPHLPGGVYGREEDRYFVVAALFALHPDPWDDPDAKPWQRNFGASMRRLAEASGQDAQGPERRFVSLLQSAQEDLPDRLRGAVALLKSKGVPVHWGQLLADLGGWSRPDRRVQRAWARRFWSDEPAPEVAVEDEDEADAEDRAVG